MVYSRICYISVKENLSKTSTTGVVKEIGFTIVSQESEHFHRHKKQIIIVQGQIINVTGNFLIGPILRVYS